jgi:hypothetical protein
MWVKPHVPLHGCLWLSSLQPLKGLSSLKEVYVSQCSITSMEGLCSMSLHALSVRGCCSLTIAPLVTKNFVIGDATLLTHSKLC